MEIKNTPCDRERFYDTYFPDDIPDEWSRSDQEKSHGLGRCGFPIIPVCLDIPIFSEFLEDDAWQTLLMLMSKNASPTPTPMETGMVFIAFTHMEQDKVVKPKVTASSESHLNKKPQPQPQRTPRVKKSSS